jgi:hypothetical protein
VESVPLVGVYPARNGDPLSVLRRPSRRTRCNSGKNAKRGHPLVLLRRNLTSFVPGMSVRGEIGV